MTISKIILDDPEKIRKDESGRSLGLFCRNLPGRVDRQLIDELKEILEQQPEKNIRLCLHEAPDALFHSMIILERQRKYYRPHKHYEKGECFHIIEGRMAVFAFDEKGNVIDSCCLDPSGVFIYRVQVNMYHAVMPLTPIVIYHESKPGPFLDNSDSIFPSWAPDDGDEEKITIYNQQLHDILGI